MKKEKKKLSSLAFDPTNVPSANSVMGCSKVGFKTLRASA